MRGRAWNLILRLRPGACLWLYLLTTTGGGGASLTTGGEGGFGGGGGDSLLAEPLSPPFPAVSPPTWCSWLSSVLAPVFLVICTPTWQYTDTPHTPACPGAPRPLPCWGRLRANSSRTVEIWV